MKNKKKVIFICTQNSSRSQMAEGLLRSMYGDRYVVYSAGTNPSMVNPFAIRVMDEIGIDISDHHSKSIGEFKDIEFDFVVTVCDSARENCPFFPGGRKYLHHSFTDPASARGSEKEILAFFRRTREEIKHWIKNTFG